MTKMICIGPNCFIPRLLLDLMANPSLAQKMMVEMPMLMTSAMLVAEANVLMVSNCDLVLVSRPTIPQVIFSTINANRRPQTTKAPMPLVMLIATRLNVARLQQTMRTCIASEISMVTVMRKERTSPAALMDLVPPMSP